MGIYDCTIAIQWLYNVYAMARSFDICKQEFDMALSQDGEHPTWHKTHINIQTYMRSGTPTSSWFM